MFEGELHDPFQEFFVTDQKQGGGGGGGGGLIVSNVTGNNVWFEKYTLRLAMLPSWFPVGLAERILNVGKSINFIRRTFDFYKCIISYISQ